MKDKLLNSKTMNHPVIIDSKGHIYDNNEYWNHVGYIYTPYVPLIITPLKGFDLIKENYEFKNEEQHNNNFFFKRIKNKITRIFSRNLVDKLFSFTKR